MMLPVLTGPLRYLIGADSPPSANGVTVEVPYHTAGKTCYGNLRDEESLKIYGPYLPGDDITDEYGELTPNPSGAGFLQNIHDQLAWIAQHSPGAVRMELDNPDSKGLPLDAVLQAHSLAWKSGLRTIGKNPMLTSDPERYLSHPSIDLVVVERGDFGSDAMDNLRRNLGQPLLAIRFVACHNEDGDGHGWALAVAAEIKARNYRNMGVTHSPDGEYTSSQDVLVPA